MLDFFLIGGGGCNWCFEDKLEGERGKTLNHRFNVLLTSANFHLHLGIESVEKWEQGDIKRVSTIM